MRLGLYLDMRNPGGLDWSDHYDQIIDLCVAADRLGCHSVWLSEHHAFPDGYLPQPLTLAAAIAVRTTRMRIGTAALLAPLRRPVDIAEQAAIVDILSHGRLDLGLGAGYRKAEFALFGADPARPLEQLFAAVAALRDLLSAGHVSPRPVQDPLPVWLACNGPRGAYRAGAMGERLLSADPALVTEFQRGRADAGLDPAGGDMAGPINLFLSDDPERDTAQIASAYAYLWDTYNVAAVEGTDTPPPAPVTMTRPLERGLSGGMRGLLVATPEDAAEQLAKRFRGTPVRTVFTWAALPGVARDLTERHVELWCTRLADLVRDI